MGLIRAFVIACCEDYQSRMKIHSLSHFSLPRQESISGAELDVCTERGYRVGEGTECSQLKIPQIFLFFSKSGGEKKNTEHILL